MFEYSKFENDSLTVFSLCLSDTLSTWPGARSNLPLSLADTPFISMSVM